MEKRWLLLLPQILVCTTDPWRRDGCLLQDAADCVIFWPVWLPLWSQSPPYGCVCLGFSSRVVVGSFLKISWLLFRVENSPKGFLPLLPKNPDLSVCCLKKISVCWSLLLPSFCFSKIIYILLWISLPPENNISPLYMEYSISFFFSSNARGWPPFLYGSLTLIFPFLSEDARDIGRCIHVVHIEDSQGCSRLLFW